MTQARDDQEYVLLCDGCAQEAGAANTENLVGPASQLHGAACQRCGAILAGFGHRVPATVFTGMNPGPG